MKIVDLILTEAKKPEVLETREQIEDWLKKRGKRIEGTWKINDDLSVEVTGDVDLSKLKMTKLPVKFKKVGGRFFVRETPLITLEGCPDEVGTWFDCSYTDIKNLIGGPKAINTSKSQYNDQYQTNNCQQLTSLEGIAEDAKELNVGFCKNLKELDYLPKNIRRITACAAGLTTLQGIEKRAKSLEALQINANNIEEYILGTLKIPSLKWQSVIFKTDKEVTPLTQAGKIIDSVLSSGGDILEVCDELIDAGLDRMAKY